MHHTGTLKLGILTALLALTPVLTACGVSQADYDAAKEKLGAKEKEAAAFQQQLDTQAKQVKETQDKLKAATSKPVILAAVPDAPPRATAVPLPAGAPTPVPPVPPDAKVVPLYAHIDTVTAGFGESAFKVDASGACVKSGLFSRGMRIVWRMELVDTSLGKVLQGTDVQDATLSLPNGEALKFRYGRHGSTETSPWYFTTAWDVPMNHPLGVLDYVVKVMATNGKSITFGDPLSMQSGAMDTRVTIVPLSTGV